VKLIKAKFDSFIEERVIQYLSILKLKVESPSYSYLERICHSHLNTFPFENISKLIYLAEGKALPSIEKFMVNYSVLNY
jgi:N-hydroxyarylamine O-acetyltransferase